MNKSGLTLSIVLVASALLPGCAAHKIKPLRSLRMHLPTPQHEESILFRAKRLNKQEVCDYFGQDIDKEHGLRSVQLSITNNSAETWVYNEASVSVPLFAKKHALHTFTRDAVTHGLYYGLGSTLAVPTGALLGVLAGASFGMCIPGAMPAIIGWFAAQGATGGAIMIPILGPILGLSGGFSVHNKNLQTQAALQRILIPEHVLIYPHQTLEGVILVRKKDYPAIAQKEATLTIALKNANRPSQIATSTCHFGRPEPITTLSVEGVHDMDA